jgi:7-keto-8-aminopelargonate synthetase-like enzyme
MDGDLALLADIVALKERYGAQLLLDEAHAVGVLGPQGRGLAAALGLTDRVDFHMGTLGKALGVAGGYLAGSRSMVDVLINKARSFIYSTAPPPMLSAAAQAALEIATREEGEERREILRGLVAFLAENLGQPAPPAAILPYQIGDEAAAMSHAAALWDDGFYVPAIRYPTVARGAARLRLTLTADHTRDQIQALTRAMADYAASHGVV